MDDSYSKWHAEEFPPITAEEIAELAAYVAEGHDKPNWTPIDDSCNDVPAPSPSKAPDEDGHNWISLEDYSNGKPLPPTEDNIHTVDSRYRMKTGSMRYWDKEEEVYVLGPSRLEEVQGAKVKKQTISYKINWTDKNYTKIKSISLLNGSTGVSKEMSEIIGYPETPPTGPVYLSEIFEITPYGIIQKNRTGIGATSLELTCPRNSIIVVPTRALAYNKVQSSRDPNTGFSPYLYVGGPTGIISNPVSPQDIIGYITNPAIAHKKLLVVADSLGKVINTIGEQVYSDYFLMVDEIDSYQIDGTYRPNLEKVIDYYFKFDLTHRCLVSATIKGFSHPLIKEEPVLDIIYAVHIERHMQAIHTNNINQTLCSHIVRLIEEHPEEKILIALNEVTGILKVINLLPEALRSQCAILCSSTNQENAGEYYQETLQDNLLSKPITFMTCLYFTGIDIDERYHLISVADATRPSTMLSMERLSQIHGRCRAESSVLSDIIIYRTKEYTKEDATESWKIKGALLKYAEDLVTFGQSAQKLLTEHSNFASKALHEFLADLEQKSAKAFFGSQPINIIRKNIEGQYATSYFNIDALVEIWKLRTELYSTQEQFIHNLSKMRNYQGDVRYTDAETEAVAEQLESETTTEVSLEQRNKDTLLSLIDRIPEVLSDESLSPFQQLVNLRRNQSPTGWRIIFTYLKMREYIDAQILSELLKKIVRENTALRIPLKNLRQSIVFWALAEDHPVKSGLKQAFRIGQTYKATQIQQSLQSVFVETDVQFPTSNSAVHFFKRLVVTSKDRTNGYKVLEYYPDIPADLTPLAVISNITRVSKPFFGL